MRKALFILMFGLAGHLSLFASGDSTSLQASILKFIDSAKRYSIEDGKYNVYVVKIVGSDYKQPKFCLTVSYMMNWYDYDRIVMRYFFNINGNIVLTDTQSANFELLKPIKIQRITSDIERQIVGKLFPKEAGGITGSPQGLVFCQIGPDVRTKYFSDVDNIPPNLSIFDSPEPAHIELLDSVKESQKRRKK